MKLNPEFLARPSLRVLFAVLATLISSDAVAQTPQFEIRTLGFDDSEHTRDDGYRFSGVLGHTLGNDGSVLGYSLRFNGSSANLGYSAWIFDGSEVSRIGFTDAEHTRTDDYQYSASSFRNSAGQALGISARYSGNNAAGNTAWIYDGSANQAIGLVDSEHVNSNGYRSSNVNGLNDAGQAIGQSHQFDNGSSSTIIRGYTAWLYDGSNTVKLGLTGAEYTRNDGYQWSGATLLTATGKVFGSSQSYADGSNFTGNVHWLYDGATTTEIGLNDNEHRGTDGRRNTSGVVSIESGNQFVGTSSRYSGNESAGSSTWIYDGTSTSKIGLTGSQYTRSDGWQGSFLASETGTTFDHGVVAGWSQMFTGNLHTGNAAWKHEAGTTTQIGFTDAEHQNGSGNSYSYSSTVNGAGVVLGTSERYDSAGQYLGQTNWVHDSTTKRIGLTGAEHTRDDGYRRTYTDAYQFNQSGYATGLSGRYEGNVSRGQSAWIYDGTVSREIGLEGSDYTSSDGDMWSTIELVNGAGQVAGYSFRYSELAFNGAGGFFYDLDSDQTTELVLSRNSQTGFAETFIKFLSDDGLVLGSYKLFDEFDNDLGSRAFYFSMTAGMQDLGLLVDESLITNDWASLAESLQINSNGQIVGHGRLNSDSLGQMGFILSRVSSVPEPNSVALLSLACLGLISRRRRNG